MFYDIIRDALKDTTIVDYSTDQDTDQDEPENNIMQTNLGHL